MGAYHTIGDNFTVDKSRRNENTIVRMRPCPVRHIHEQDITRFQGITFRMFQGLANGEFISAEKQGEAGGIRYQIEFLIKNRDPEIIDLVNNGGVGRAHQSALHLCRSGNEIVPDHFDRCGIDNWG